MTVCQKSFYTKDIPHEFLAWLLFLKTRLCKEKKATRTFICWVFVATKKKYKNNKKNLKKTKTNKTQKNSSRIF